MQGIKEIVLTLCSVLVISGFFMKLFPKTKLEKNVKMLFSAVILIIIISPLMGSFNISSEFGNAPSGGINEEKSEEHYRKYTANKTLEIYLESIENHLEEKGLSFRDVTVNYDLLEEAVEIKEIVVTAENEKAGAAAEKEIEKNFGVNASSKVGE